MVDTFFWGYPLRMSAGTWYGPAGVVTALARNQAPIVAALIGPAGSGGGGGGVTDGDKGDIVVSGSGATWMIDSAVLTTPGRALIAAVDIPAQRTALGLGSAALQATAFFQAALGYTPENAASRGVVNGYASLDGSGKVPSAQLPAYVDDVLEFANFAALPATGTVGILYVTLNDNRTWRWSGSAYVEISPSPGSTDSVPEGSVNFYFTNARTIAAPLTGYVAGANTVLAATDTILQAFGKLQGQLTAAFAAIPGSTSALTEGTNLYFTNARVLSAPLTGLSVATSTAIVAADSVLVALGKLQAQITAGGGDGGVNTTDLTLFGDGSDGNVTISSNITLTRDVYYNDLTMAAGGSITTAGFRIFVKGTLSDTGNVVGAFRNNGTVGANASGTPGGAAGAAVAGVTVGGSSAGTAGGAGSTGVGAQAAAPTAATSNMGGIGGAGGKGGNSTSAGGASRAATAPVTATVRRLTVDLFRGPVLISGGVAGSAGSGGGGDGTVTGRGGGGSPSGGGVIFIAAANIVLSASTPAAWIRADGAVGGLGGFAAANAGGGGGAGGSGGGVVFIIYKAKTGTVVTDLIEVDGGTGGAGNGNTGTGFGGDGGTGGGCGRVIVANITAGTMTELLSPGVGGAAGSAGTVGSGGAGGAGEQGRATL
jgi:hypothetical protein